MNTYKPYRKPSAQTATPLANPLLVEARQLRMKKRFSQNMLVSETVLNQIVASVAAEPAETVVEIGPGMGFLTRLLLNSPAALVVAIELEHQMVNHLKQTYGHQPKLQLVEQDILKFDFSTITTPQFKVVGNLPYNITSPILFALCGELACLDHPLRQRLQQVTLMVQKEVGERVTAHPGQKGYNALSIALQNWFETKLVFTVPANAFYPAPKVQSAVIQLTPRPQSVIPVTQLKTTTTLIKLGFHQKRKTLKNAWQSLASASTMTALYEKAQQAGLGNIAACRAEQIPIETFGQLAALYESVIA